MSLLQEIDRRRTFGIISHPDAGKTTLTEKLLLFGGAIQEAGAVKSNKIKKGATSDFMEIERQRGISVATSVLAFIYKDKKIHLTNRESQLLQYLLNHKNNLCSHKDILTHIWGKNDYFNKKSLNVFITHLRKYLSNDAKIKLENVHNRGFILKIEGDN